MALTTLAGSLRAQGATTNAITHYTEALALFRTLGHQRGTAATLSGLAAVHLDAGQAQQVVGLLRECL